MWGNPKLATGNPTPESQTPNPILTPLSGSKPKPQIPSPERQPQTLSPKVRTRAGPEVQTSTPLPWVQSTSTSQAQNPQAYRGMGVAVSYKRGAPVMPNARNAPLKGGAGGADLDPQHASFLPGNRSRCIRSDRLDPIDALRKCLVSDTFDECVVR
jgi:hypothetical protein